MAGQPFLCVHGHFYQPPRENPWLGSVERQVSAAPQHDWNARVSAECYEVNAVARIYNDHGEILRAVNNFEWINFNIGPTLFAWLARHRPVLYRLILAADRRSAARLEGHGNAIAQVYNHMIMPLANRRDQLTQVRWGKAEFRARFGREPEAMWLPETACDEATLDVLQGEGLRYAILAPRQARACRPLGEEGWREVPGATIDPTRPYRCFLGPERERYIDLFFYDGPLSHAVSFENLLTGSARFADRLMGLPAFGAPGEPLVSLATDGETFGHHHRFGERVLGHLLVAEAPRRGFTTTNFGHFLAHHPPQWEVQLDPGPHGRGTSWSCEHGVERWRANCGCRTGGPGRWNQEWRTPLREALDWLRDRLAEQFERGAGPLLRDPWAARDGYIDLILDRSDAALDRFFGQHGHAGLAPAQRSPALKWLEAQHQGLLMFASCAWFFNDLSGIETVQGLRYAARAMELAQGAGGAPLEAEFRERVARARVNRARYRDGGRVFDLLALPARVAPGRVAAHAALTFLLLDGAREEAIDDFRVAFPRAERKIGAGGALALGEVEVTHHPTRATHAFYFAAASGDAPPWCCLREREETAGSAGAGFTAMGEALVRAFAGEGAAALRKKAQPFFGATAFSLQDVLETGRERLLAAATREAVEGFDQAARTLGDEAARLAAVYRKAGVPLPEPLPTAARRAAATELRRAVQAALSEPGAEAAALPATLLREARRRGVPVDVGEVRRSLQQALEKATARMAEQADPGLADACLAALEVTRSLGFEPAVMNAQNTLLAFLAELEGRGGVAGLAEGEREKLRRLADALSVRLETEPPSAGG